MNKILPILLLLLALKLNAQNGYLLEGVIGKHPVVMCITQDDDTTFSARYFYNNNLQDIFLEGNPNSNSTKFIFTKTTWNYKLQRDTFCERMSLSTKNYKTWIGSWTNGRYNLGVRLTNIDTNKIKLPKQREYSFDEGLDRYYSFIRESKITLKKDSVSKANQLTLQWYNEKASRIKLFRVIAGISDTTILNKVNKTLHEFQMNEICAFYDCSNNDRKRGVYYFHLDSVYATENFLSIDAGGYNDCGGIHPNSSTDYLNFNLHTGNKIDKITDVFNLYDSSLYSEFETDANDSTNEYTLDISASEDSIGYCISKFMQRLHKKEMQFDDSLHDNECSYNSFYRWQFFNFVFRYDGVYFNPHFAHAIQSCSYPEWALITYSVLKKYLKKESQFVF